MTEKLATCCYCGRRSALCVRNHALACGSCGAPLRDMKALRPAQARAAASHAATKKPHKMRKPKRIKKRKSIWEKIFDEIEDIFD